MLMNNVVMTVHIDSSIFLEFYKLGLILFREIFGDPNVLNVVNNEFLLLNCWVMFNDEFSCYPLARHTLFARRRSSTKEKQNHNHQIITNNNNKNNNTMLWHVGDYNHHHTGPGFSMSLAEIG